ncbi:MAG: phosphate signaling complex protein PhoU [Porticoccaceae bacterium]|nr:phosphate signaling complex protein PhoU [Porticoccaceae bacterium]
MVSEIPQAEKHIFQKFDVELANLVDKLLEMGGLVEKQLNDAINAFTEMDTELASAVIVNEEQVDEFDVEIDQLCVRLIAMRQPTASDLRLILGVGKSVQDLERIGDEADKIAQLTLQMSEEGSVSTSIGRSKIRYIAKYVSEMLRQVLDAYGRLDADLSLTIARKDKIVEEEQESATRELVTYMMEDPRSISTVMHVMWGLRSLERVGDHVENMAEHLIYTVKGVDVRHSTLKEMKKKIRKLAR